MNRATLLSVFFCRLLLLCVFVQSQVTRRELLNNLTSITRYDRSYPADYDGPIPTDVIVQVEVSDVPSIREQDMEYSTMMFLRMKWVDKRLAFYDLANFSRIELIGDMVDVIWIPDVFISNERQVDPHSFVKHEELAYIDPYGIVTFSMRASMTNNCHMQLMHYPFDEQICNVKFKSYTFPSDKLHLQWSENSVYTSNIDLTNYKVEIGDQSQGLDMDDKRSLAGGEFSYLIMRIKFIRKSDAYGSMYFAPFPVFFIVALCSFGFWDEIKVRIALCTVGISTTVLQWITIYSRLPHVWYFTYLDGWILFHIIMILLLIIFHVFWYLCVYKKNELVEDLEDSGKIQKFLFAGLDDHGKKVLKRNKIEAIWFGVFLILYLWICVCLLIAWADVCWAIGLSCIGVILVPVIFLKLSKCLYFVLRKLHGYCK